MAVVKLFSDPTVAVNAIRDLQSKGLGTSEIGVAAGGDDTSELIARRAEIPLTNKIAAAEVGTLALSGPAATCDSMSCLADVWGVPQGALVYYESGLRRGGVVISVHADAAMEGQAKSALRDADPFHIIPVDPPINDRPFFLSERVTKSDDRDRLFSGDFRKY